MANLTYKQVINAATQGFRNIQGALASLTDLSISAVSSATSNGVVTYSGNITPAAMVTAINHLATIKKANTTNSVTDDGTFIKGRVAYRGAGSVTDAITIDGTTATLTKTLPAGYYTGISINSSASIDTGSVELSGAGVSASNLDSSGEPTNSFKPADVVAKAAATTAGYSYAKISRAAVSRSVTDGYVTSAQVSGLTAAAISYVKIKNAEYSSTAPTIALSQGIAQAEYVGDTNQNTADLDIIQSTKPSGAHYRITATPSYTTSATGSATVSVAGYSQQGTAVSGISVGKSSSNEAVTRYILKSAIDTSVSGLSTVASISWDSKAVRVTKGYYPADRKIALSMSEGNIGISFKNSGNDLKPTFKYYNGSSNSSDLSGSILKSTTTGMTRYYTLSYTAGVDKTHNTDGYIAGSGSTTSTGTVNLPADTTIYRYIAEASGSLTASVTSNPVVTYSQSQTTGALYTLAEGGDVVDTGIITNAAYTANNSLLTGDAGVDYWRIEAIASQSPGGIKATVSSATSGYLDTGRIRNATNGTLNDATNTVQATLSKSSDATFYVKKATLTQDIVGTKAFNTNTPVISVQSGGNVTTGSATSSVPNGYFVIVKTAATSGTTSLAPKYTVTKGGYLPKSTTITRSAETVTATVPASNTTYIPITSGAAHNGYVTTAGWIPNETPYYTTTYDSTEQCVDFIFNN